MLQTQRVVSEAFELYTIAAQTTNTDRIPAIGVITNLIQITLLTTMVRNKIVDTIGIDVEAMIIVHAETNKISSGSLGIPRPFYPIHRRTTQPPHDEEFDNEEYYEADILLCYHTLVRDRVGQE